MKSSRFSSGIGIRFTLCRSQVVFNNWLTIVIFLDRIISYLGEYGLYEDVSGWINILNIFDDVRILFVNFVDAVFTGDIIGSSN